MRAAAPARRRSWVCEVLRMTRLAPDIIRAIMDGRQPRHLNLHAMRGRQGEVPLNWDEQRGMFEIGSDMPARQLVSHLCNTTGCQT